MVFGGGVLEKRNLKAWPVKLEGGLFPACFIIAFRSDDAVVCRAKPVGGLGRLQVERLADQPGQGVV